MQCSFKLPYEGHSIALVVSRGVQNFKGMYTPGRCTMRLWCTPYLRIANLWPGILDVLELVLFPLLVFVVFELFVRV